MEMIFKIIFKIIRIIYIAAIHIFSLIILYVLITKKDMKLTDSVSIVSISLSLPITAKAAYDIFNTKYRQINYIGNCPKCSENVQMVLHEVPSRGDIGKKLDEANKEISKLHQSIQKLNDLFR